MTKIAAIAGDITQTPADALVVNLFEGVTKPGGGTGAVDSALDGAISSLIADGEIKGKQGETTLIHTLGKLPAKRVVVAGLGKQEKFSTDVVREVSGDVARYLAKIGVTEATTLAHGAGVGGLAPEEAAQAMAEGTYLGLSHFNQYRTKNDDTPERDLETLLVVERDKQKVAPLNRGLDSGKMLADCVVLARTMVNEPANVMTPTRMADIAGEVAKETGLQLRVISRQEMEKWGMGAILAVSAGTAQEPKLIVLEYRGDPDNAENNVALVGKGITFDSGGISIKPASDMWEMKGDMSGGASVIAAMRGIGLLKPRINVFGLVPAVENMPSGTAQRPGDIIRAMNGKTIEVDNTDAEGRLVLADAMCFARQELKARRLVDIATLTGAIVVALGNVATGIMGHDQPLIDAVLAASKATGEKMWQLPMFDEYKEQIRSDWADVKNTGGRGAGSITAGFFLSEFTDGTPWAHLDIAGTFLSKKEKGHLVKGATGVPTRTLIRLVQDLAQG